MHVPQYAGQLWFNLTSTSGPCHIYIFITAVVAAGVGSAVVVLLLAIMIVLTVTAVVTSCKKKGERHFWIIQGSLQALQYNYIPHTVNTDLDEPYYSTVYTGRPDAIEMKENDAYGRPRPARQKIIVEENPAYGVTGQYGGTNRQN